MADELKPTKAATAAIVPTTAIDPNILDFVDLKFIVSLVLIS